MKTFRLIVSPQPIKILFLSVLFILTAHAQEKTSWHNKKCAIVLTYDDALNVHLDNVIPVLDSLKLKGTFYLSGYFPGFRNRLADWKSAAKKGHELGNHTLFHPCNRNLPGREWVNPNYALEQYTLQRILDEIRMTNTVLEAVDGKTKRTFAYPCGEMKVGDTSYVESIKEDFVGARGVNAQFQKINEVNVYNIGSYMVNGETGDELIALAKKAMNENALLVFLFHGVGGEHSINVPLSEHNKLVTFLKNNDKDIWVAPLVEIVDYIILHNTKVRK